MTEVFGPFENVTIEQILESRENGQIHQMAVMINYYGQEFWYDYAKWLNDQQTDDFHADYSTFVLVVISYNTWYPHPQQLPGGEKLERPI